MAEYLIAQMRARIAQLRRVLDLAHDPEIRRIVQKVIDDGLNDIEKLEAEQRGAN